MANIAFKQIESKRFGLLDDSVGTCSFAGTAVKLLLLLIVMLCSAGFSWVYTADNPETMTTLFWVSLFAALIIAFAIIKKPEWSAFLSQGYAIFEGIALGYISVAYNNAYDGIVGQAIFATLAVTIGMYLLWSFRIIKVTERFRSVVVGMTFGIALIYFASIGLSFFGITIPLLFEGGIVGIGFSLVVIGVASLNLAIDFEMVNQVIEARAPKYLEWYCGFGILVTVVWIYLEILRLLAKRK